MKTKIDAFVTTPPLSDGVVALPGERISFRGKAFWYTGRLSDELGAIEVVNDAGQKTWVGLDECESGERG